MSLFLNFHHNKPMFMKTNRRRFMTTSAVAAAGISMGHQVFAVPSIIKKYNQNDTVRMGFIG
jgi:hypothetical protein